MNPKKPMLKPFGHCAGVREAARATGRSQAHISYVLRGMRKPGKELAKALQSLGLTVPGAKKGARR